jgi:tetraacyldisaccharide 4'-kinase
MLRLPAATWAAIGRLRVALYRGGWLRTRKLERPVISVGALSVGGAGKTPATAMIASLLQEAGHRPAILSRGYRRQGSEPLLVSGGDGGGPRTTAAAAGDEPFWLASVLPGVPVAVAGRREEAARLALAAAQVDAFVLDDGFQHLRVGRDVDLLVVDAAVPFWRDLPLPIGRLRESPAAADRADALLLIGGDAETAAEARRRHPRLESFLLAVEPPRAWRQGQPSPAAGAEPPNPAAALELPSPVYAFAGIARPERFFGGLERAGVELSGRRTFPDHHAFGAGELAELDRAAAASGARALVTTEKDAVRLPDPVPGAAGRPIWVWGYRLAARDPEALRAWLCRRSGLEREPRRRASGGGGG